MTTTPSKRPEIDKATLLTPLSEGGGVGVYLRYDPVYDQIREARREDDDTLSQGIWKTEIKKADWVLVESLCAVVLQKQSKDLQILAWLCEAWVALDGLQGVIDGLTLIHQLSKTFWPIIHPIPDGDDIEHRLRIFEWLNEFIGGRIMFIPLTNSKFDSHAFTLVDWVSAVNLETVVKRSTEGKNLLAEAEAGGKATLSRFRKSLNLTSLDQLKTTCSKAETASQIIQDLMSFLEEFCGDQTPNFPRVRTCLNDIVRICKTSLDQRGGEVSQVVELPSEEPKSLVTQSLEQIDADVSIEESLAEEVPDEENVVISERTHAYKALKDISAFLKGLDPHSPVPYLVELVSTWEGKTLFQILTEVEQGVDEPHRILKLIANGANTVSSGSFKQ